MANSAGKIVERAAEVGVGCTNIAFLFSNVYIPARGENKRMELNKRTIAKYFQNFASLESVRGSGSLGVFRILSRLCKAAKC